MATDEEREMQLALELSKWVPLKFNYCIADPGDNVESW